MNKEQKENENLMGTVIGAMLVVAFLAIALVPVDNTAKVDTKMKVFMLKCKEMNMVCTPKPK
jgi:hypothetical protein